MDDWQQWILRHALGERDEKWSALTVGVCMGRQNGKNEILLVRELFGLIVLGEREILHTAHLQKAADTQFRRVLEVIRDVPELGARLGRKNASYGMQEIELRTGQRIIFTTRQGSKTGRSMTLDLVVHDECMYISDAALSGVMPAMAAHSLHGNLQTWYAGSAPDADEPDHDGAPFARVREAALDGDERTMWAEWSVEAEDRDRVPAEWLTSVEKLGEATPSLGIRISVDWAEAEAKQLSRRDFLRERLGITRWPDGSDDAGRVISQEAWDAAACRDESMQISGAKVFAVDSNVDNTWTSVAVAGMRPDGLWHFALVERRRKTKWLVGFCEGLAAEHLGCQFVVDVRGPLHHLLEDFQAADLKITEADTTDYSVACAGFVDAVEQGTARYPSPQPELSDAVNDARKQTLGDRWKWSRRNSTSADISPLVAASLALWGAQTLQPAEPHVWNMNELLQEA